MLTFSSWKPTFPFGFPPPKPFGQLLPNAKVSFYHSGKSVSYVREEIDGPVALSAVLSNTFHAARAVTRGAPFRLPSPLKNPANVTVRAKVSCWFSKVSLKDRSCRGVPYHAESTLSRSAQVLKLPSFAFQNSFLSSLLCSFFWVYLC